jgi:hypothetical protein
MPEPTFGEITFDDQSLYVGSALPADADVAAAECWTVVFEGTVCAREPSMAVTLPLEPCRHTYLGLDSLVGGNGQTTELGEVRVWQKSSTSIEPDALLFIPEAAGADRWTLPTSSPWPTDATATIMIDGGEAVPATLSIAEASADLSGADASATIRVVGTWQGAAFEFTAGAMDELALEIDGVRHEGGIGHVPPSDTLQAGEPSSERYLLVAGPWTLASAGDPPTEHTVSLALEWNLGVIARPSL